MERLRRAGKELLQWRDLRAPWRREPFDRDAEVKRRVNELCEFADLTAKASWNGDPSSADSRNGIPRPSCRRSDFRRAQADGGSVRSRPDQSTGGVEALVIRTSKQFRDIRTGKQPRYGDGVTRPEVIAAKDALEQSLLTFARRADADLAALLQQELLTCVDSYDDLKTRAGALDFLDLLLRARDLVRDCAPVRHAFQDRFQLHPRRRVPGHGSAASGDPVAARRG